MTDNFKLEITLQDEVTNKLIQSDPMLYQKPKIKSLKETFLNLFKKEEKEQTIEEQIALLRSMKQLDMEESGETYTCYRLVFDKKV